MALAVFHRMQLAAERSGIDWLICNPFKMYRLHTMTARDSRAVDNAFERTFPHARSYVDVGAGSAAHSAELQRPEHLVMACERSVDSRQFNLAAEPPAVL